MDAVGLGGKADAPRALTVLKTVAHMLLPVTCACGHPGVHLCETCAASLYEEPLRVDSVCEALQISTPIPGREHYLPVMPVFSLGEYSGCLRALILDYKNGGHFVLAPLLAERLASMLSLLACHGEHPHVVVPAPSTRAAVRRRGEEHMRLLASHLVREPGCTLAPHLILEGASQHSLNRRDRSLRATRTLRMRQKSRWRELRGAHALIIDDVVTTGSTLRTLERFLTQVGLHTCAALTLASARLPRPLAVPRGPARPKEVTGTKASRKQ